MKGNVRRIAFCGVFTALAMVFSYIESLIPIPVPIYGIKLGIANIAILAVIYAIGWKEAVIVNFLRILWTAILFGNMNSFLFSAAGGALSLLVMIACYKSRKFSILGVSIAGGAAHNIGQVAMAVWLMDSTAIIYYLPILLAAGVFTGAIIGIAGGLTVKHIKASI